MDKSVIEQSKGKAITRSELIKRINELLVKATMKQVMIIHDLTSKIIK